MSWWTYVRGTITVSPMGRTQAEKRYILDTVLDHLPIVSGSERNMNVYVIQKDGYNHFSSHNEFGIRGRKGGLEQQDEYILVVDGALRDRKFDETYREFQKWMCRLAKRVMIENVLVNIDDHYFNSSVIRNDDGGAYYKMFENPFWCNKDGEVNWCEYLMWERMKDCEYPRLLGYKYYADEENDKLVEAWLER